MAVYDRWYRTEKRTVTHDDGSTEVVRAKVRSADYGCAMRWQVRWRDEQGNQRKKNFAKKQGVDPNTCASAFDAKLRDQLKSGTYLNPEDGKVLFRKYAEDWRTNQLHREQTRTLVERALRLHINPVIGEKPLSGVRPKHVQKLVNQCAEKLDASTVEIVYGYVASIFRAAVAEPVIGRSPCVGIRLPPKDVEEITPLDAQTVMALAEALPDRYAAIVLTAAGTGLRPSEVFGLEVECIDFLRRTLRVRQQLLTASTKPYATYLGQTKTPQSVRTIPLTQGVVDMLAAHLAEFPTAEVELEDRTDPHKPVTRKAKLVFTTSRGTPIKRQTWGDIWRPAARAVGLPPRTGLHICRHTFASALIRFGESAKTVQKLMGHASPTITMNIYAHLWPDSDDRARSAVDALFADVPSMCPEASEG